MRLSNEHELRSIVDPLVPKGDERADDVLPVVYAGLERDAEDAVVVDGLTIVAEDETGWEWRDGSFHDAVVAVDRDPETTRTGPDRYVIGGKGIDIDGDAKPVR